MSVLMMKTRSITRARTLSAWESPIARAAALSMTAVVAGTVFSAGWALADMVLKAF